MRLYLDRMSRTRASIESLYGRGEPNSRVHRVACMDGVSQTRASIESLYGRGGSNLIGRLAPPDYRARGWQRSTGTRPDQLGIFGHERSQGTRDLVLTVGERTHPPRRTGLHRVNTDQLPAKHGVGLASRRAGANLVP